MQEKYIDLGPIFCQKCLTKDSGLNIGSKYNIRKPDDKYVYYYDTNKSIDRMESTKFIEKINIGNIKNSVIIQHFRFGRVGNFLFTLAHLAIVYQHFIDYFEDNKVEMLTNWHETYFTDVQSRKENIYKYNCDNDLLIFKNIKCRHFSHNDIFCSTCVDKLTIKNGDKTDYYLELKFNDKVYGSISLIKRKQINSTGPRFCALYILINEPIGTNHFEFNNIIFTDEYDKELFKYKYYLNPKCVKIVSIGGHTYGFDDKLTPKYENKANIYKFTLYFNYAYMKSNDNILKKHIFNELVNHQDNYKSKIKQYDIQVCMHLRGCDYSIGETFTYPIMYYTYYLRCLKDIQEKENSKLKVLFCFHPNDYKLALFYRRKIMQNLNLQGLNDIEIIFESDISEITNGIKNEIEHIYFMSSFKYYVMSNSSYSFWSAYLSVGGNIYYPKYYGIRYDGNTKNTLKVDNYIAYTVFGDLFKEDNKYIMIDEKKVLHPAYFISTMNLEKEDLTDHRLELIDLFKDKIDVNDDVIDLYLKNVISTLEIGEKKSDILNIVQKHKKDYYKYTVHADHLELYQQYVQNDKYNFDSMDEMYVSDIKSILK